MSHPYFSSTQSQLQGLGDPNPQFNVYIGNRPSCDLIQANRAVQPLKSSDIGSIGQACGNGWRKVFNVYAKILFALGRNHFPFNANYPSWQAYRESELLQLGSRTALWFSPPEAVAKPGIELIMGRTYAKSLQLPVSLTWLNAEFALAKERNLIVCPYFDYRQLSNQKILYLVDLLTNLKANNTVGQ